MNEVIKKKKARRRSARTARAQTIKTQKKQKENKKIIKDLLADIVEKELEVVVKSFSQKISRELVEFLQYPEEIKKKLVEELFVMGNESLAMETAKTCSPKFKKGLVWNFYRYGQDRLAKKATKELGVQLTQKEVEDAKWRGWFDDLL